MTPDEAGAVVESISVANVGQVPRETGFSRLVATELASGYRTAALILRDSIEAEDAIQDALVRAWQHWDELRDADRLSAWFGRILVNVCRDRLNARRSTIWVDIADASMAASTASAADAAADGAERDALWRAIERLRPDHRVVVVLRFYLDLPVAEIAGRLGVSEGTVKSRLHYSLSALRAAYDADARAPEPAS